MGKFKSNGCKCAAWVILLLPLLITCEKNPPEITNVFWQLTFTKEIVLGSEAADLSLFINAADEDGLEDIETIFLFNDKEELYWEINSNNWYKSDTWIGINNIRMADNSELPAGEYRVVLQDIGGETDEQYIQIGFAKIKKTYPAVKIEKDMLSIKGSQEYYALRVYNSNNKFITNYIYNTGKEINIQQEIMVKNNIQQESFFYVYYFDQKQDTGFSIGPYYF